GNPYGLGIDSAGNLYTADYTNFVVQKITMRGQSFTFPATNVGQQSAPLLPTIVIANIGNENLVFNSIAVSQNFELQDSRQAGCSVSTPLAAGASCTLGLVFAPGQNGTLTGVLSLITNSL